MVKKLLQTIPCVFVLFYLKPNSKSGKNLLASDYKIYMVCLLVATVNWHKLLLDYYITPAYNFIEEPRFCVAFSPTPLISLANHAIIDGVKISDLVPFTVSQTLVDYLRPSWYV